MRTIIIGLAVMTALPACGGDEADPGDSSGAAGRGAGGAGATGGTGAGRSSSSGSGGSGGTAGGVPLEGAVKIAVDAYTACAVLEDGHVWCWGLDENGELGDGEPSDVPSFRAQEVPDLVGGFGIAKNSGGTCVVLEDGGVACWGDLSVDFAGLSPRLTTPTIVPGAEDVVEFRLTHFLDGYKACALDRNDAVICWRADGVVPRDPDICLTDADALPSVGLALSSSRSAVTFERSLDGCSVRELRGLEGASALSRGTGLLGGGVCGILEGRVWCAPDISSDGEFELMEVELPADAVALDQSGGQRHCALLDNQELWCWGGLAVLDLQEPHLVLTGDIVDFAVALDTGCAVLADTTVKCWGTNQQGQRGSDAAREDPPSLVLR
jgi:hypothetical protein